VAHVITTKKYEEEVTRMMAAIWDHTVPMDQLPQCLFGNVVADISGPNVDPSPMKVNNLNKGLAGQLDIAFKPRDNNTNRQQKNCLR
jgi:hypothetical protein